MRQPCGCCAGVEADTPLSEINRPGLPAIVYRMGDYATFLETMLARLSTQGVGLAANEIDSWLLTRDQWLQPAKTAGRLKAGLDSVARYLRTQFSPGAQQLLDQYDGVGAPSDALKSALTSELNRLLQGASLHAPGRFTGVAPTSEIQSLLDLEPPAQGQDLLRLNRLLVEAAFPGEIAEAEILHPLRRLATRDSSDPSIALLDAWAIVGDVLTFYQERVANEGYLRTATERRSILELARLVGYELRPGVAASVYLAFTASSGFEGEIPAGVRAQSIPGAGETPQFFETSAKLVIREAWNNLRPRLTRPQTIMPSGVDPGAEGGPLAFGADIVDTLYFRGISTNLKTGDALLLVSGEDPNATPRQQVLRFVESIDPQPLDSRTLATLALPPPENSGAIDALVDAAAQPFINKARTLFVGNDLAQSVADALEALKTNVASLKENAAGQSAGAAAADFVRGVVPLVRQSQDLAKKRGFTRLSAWSDHLMRELSRLIAILPPHRQDSASGKPVPQSSTLEYSSLGNLVGTVSRLSLAPSVQPANSRRLVRNVAQTFAPQSDIAPRLLAAFHPAAASALYDAWGNVETPPSRVEAQALRVRAGFFGGNFAGPPVVARQTIGGTTNTVTTFPYPPTLGAYLPAPKGPGYPSAWGFLIADQQSSLQRGLDTVPLDAVYDQIEVGGWVVIDRPTFTRGSDNEWTPNTGVRAGTTHRVKAVRTSTFDTTTGFVAKVTLLTLQPPWLTGADGVSPADDIGAILAASANSNLALRDTRIHAQSEPLDLAEEPIEADVEGASLDLSDLYDGLEPGRWIIVSGARTDIPNVSGVLASELVMIAAVNQGTQASSAATPPDFIPFSNILYTTDANAFGDRLVVGELNPGAFVQIASLQPNPPSVPNQKYADQIQLAPGVFASAYVPTKEERSGGFPDFLGLLLDPNTWLPFPGGILPSAMSGVAGANAAGGGSRPSLFAWRISSEPTHTILTLANGLAYTYDASTVSIYGNVAAATQGQTVGEALGDGDASQAFQTFALGQEPLTFVSAPTPAGAESTLVVRVNELDWRQADNLGALGPTDRGYVTMTDDSDRTSVLFGDGAHGARPATGSLNVKAVYRYGIGKSGNVDAQRISQLATHPLGLQRVINPLPATGGADRDSADQARRNAPLAVKALDRLVGIEDYADFARTFAGVGKASAMRLTDGRRQLTHVTIAGADDIPIGVGSDLYRNLAQALTQFGDPSLPVRLCIRKVKLLVVVAGVRVLADYQWESVEPNIRAAMLDAFGFEARELGQSAFASEAIGVMQAIEGVDYVDMRKFDCVAEDVTAKELAALATTLRRRSFVEAKSAALDPTASPRESCKRIRPAEIVFLTPDIPDTLILTEIAG